MRLLVIGGTSFLGRHLVDEALQRGVAVTIFNRGVTNPDLFPSVERLRGERTRDLSVLDGRVWDAVVDTCGFVPSVVRASVSRLARSVGHYTFVSSISVYVDLTRPGCDETRAASPPDFETPEETLEAYGPLKHACEIEVERAFAGRALVVRPGFIVGPFDPVPRFAYWLRRAARGGVMAAPGAPERAIQLVDARDIAAWIIDRAAGGGAGVFNVTAPPGRLTMGAFLDTVLEVTGGVARLVWADDARLAAAGVRPVDGLPYWLPASARGVMQVSVARAVAEGFTARPFVETARDTWAWLAGEPAADPPHVRTPGRVSIACGLSPADERRLLAALETPPATAGGARRGGPTPD